MTTTETLLRIRYVELVDTLKRPLHSTEKLKTMNEIKYIRPILFK